METGMVNLNEIDKTCKIESVLPVKIINKSNNPLPSYTTEGASGLDLYANLNEVEVALAPLQRQLIPTGVYIELPERYEAQIRPRSGLAVRHGLTIVNTPGTIDSDYRGEIKICLVNLSNENFVIKHGERIAQMVIAKYEKICWNEVNELSNTQRGTGGFGHTGK